MDEDDSAGPSTHTPDASAETAEPHIPAWSPDALEVEDWRNSFNALGKLESKLARPIFAETEERQKSLDHDKSVVLKLLIGIRTAVFDSSTEVVDSFDRRVLNMHLVEYLDQSKVNELGIYAVAAADLALDKESIDRIATFLENWLASVLRDLRAGNTSHTIDNFGTTTEESALESWSARLGELQRTREIEAFQALRSAQEDAEQARDALQAAAGETANSSLSKHFGELAEQEKSTAFRWSLVAIAALLMASVFGVLIVARTPGGSWNQTLVHPGPRQSRIS